MAKATFVSGNKLPVTYKAVADIEVDDIVVAGKTGNVSIGVVTADCLNGAEVMADIGGTYTFPKRVGAIVFAGETVNWDVSLGSVDDNAATAATGDVVDFGVCTHQALTNDTEITIALTPGTATITA